jgi:hypothetical protein
MPFSNRSIRIHRAAAFVYALVFAFVAMASLSHAQVWLSNRQYAEGIGVKLGSSMVFHPGLGVEAGYDSNTYRSEDHPIGAARLRIAPYFDFATLPPQRLEGEGAKPSVEFRLGLAGVYEDWFGSDASLNDRRDFGVMTDLHFVLFPYGKWRLEIDDSFTRTIAPPNESGPKNFTRDFNDAGIGVKFVPGDALSVGLRYNFILNFYELSSLRDAGNYQQHKIQLNTLWKFLPKTALTFDGDFTPFIRKGSHLQNTSIYVAKTAYNLNLWAGLVGLFTKRFGAALRAGYGGGFYANGDDLDTWLLHGELRFFTTPMSVLRAGFIRDVRPSYFTNFYVRNQAYLGYEQLIKGRVLLSGKVTGAYLQYSTMWDDSGGALTPVDGTLMSPNAKRDDWVIGVVAFGEYRIRDWIAINLTFEYEGDITDYRVGTPADPMNYIPESYHKFAVFGGVRAHY